MKDYKFIPFNDIVETDYIVESYKDQFCPVCDKNWNHGHGHEGCNTLPIEDGYLGLLIPIAIYAIFKIKRKL